MLEKYGFFDSLEEDEREYTQDDFSRFGRALGRDGVRGGDDALKICPAATGLAVTLNAGLALVNGYHYELLDDGSGAMTFNLTAPTSATRYDRIVLRWNAQDRTVRAVLLQGTESETQTPPSLTRDSEYYMLSLGQIRVRVGASAITEEDIIDERADGALCGLHAVSSDAAMRAAKEALAAAQQAQKAAEAAAAAAAAAKTAAANAMAAAGVNVPLSGAPEGSVVATDASGNMVASGRTIDSLGTGVTYSLSGTTLTITTL